MVFIKISVEILEDDMSSNHVDTHARPQWHQEI